MKGFPAPRLLPSRQSEDRWKLDLFCRQTWWNMYFSTVHLIPMKDSTAVCLLPVLWLFPYQAYYANPYLVLISAGKRSTTMFKKVPINRHSKAERTFFKWKTCRHPKHVVRFTRILKSLWNKGRNIVLRNWWQWSEIQAHMQVYAWIWVKCDKWHCTLLHIYTPFVG